MTCTHAFSASCMQQMRPSFTFRKYNSQDDDLTYINKQLQGKLLLDFHWKATVCLLKIYLSTKVFFGEGTDAKGEFWQSLRIPSYQKFVALFGFDFFIILVLLLVLFVLVRLYFLRLVVFEPIYFNKKNCPFRWRVPAVTSIRLTCDCRPQES